LRETLGKGDYLQLAVLNTKLEVLKTTERSQELSTKLVSPVSKESEFSSSLETALGDGSIVDLGGKSGRTSARGRVSSTVAVQEVHAIDLAASGDLRAGAIETVVTGVDRVPGSKVTPCLGDVKGVTEVLCGTVSRAGDEREGLCWAVVVGVRGSSLDCSRLTGESSARYQSAYRTYHIHSGRCGLNKANDRLRSEENRVDLGAGRWEDVRDTDPSRRDTLSRSSSSELSEDGQDSSLGKLRVHHIVGSSSVRKASCYQEVLGVCHEQTIYISPGHSRGTKRSFPGQNETSLS